MSAFKILAIRCSAALWTIVFDDPNGVRVTCRDLTTSAAQEILNGLRCKEAA